MVSGKTKRVVVIKDIPSNMIEEAILILKNDAGPREEKEQKNSSAKDKPLGNDYLLREAEMVINNYMRESKMAAAARRNPDLERKKLPRARFLTNTVINAALIVCAALLLFIVSKLF